ncbi:MAG: zinc-ribbon and DUF3426 domain-containing protein [Steroidobacteraceae bacterium]
MFTVCPKCMLTLAVTANDLRMGQGYVRCGRCANVFNALLTLSEEPSEDHSAPATPADRATQSQITAALRDDTADTESQPVRSQVEGVSGPPTQLPTEQSSDGAIENESTFAAGTGTFETIVLEGEAITQIEEYVPEESVDSELASLTHRLELAAQDPTAASLEGQQADVPAIDAAQTPAAEADAAGPDAAIDTADTDGAGAAAADGSAEFEPPPQRGRPQRRWPWIAGSAALALLLLLQAVHHWRDALAATAPLNGPLTRAYAAMGMPLDPHWDLSAYDVRQQGATADPTDSQLIRVRLSLANHAARAQPLPLLRLTLLDRYGKRIASSDLAPEQYWPGGSPPRAFLGQDERVDSEVVVRDPSAASASFELDVCLRNAAGILHCAGDTAPR